MLQNISLVRPHLVLLLFLPFVLLDAGRLKAQETEDGEAYPKAPIKVIVPFGAGGGSDTFARIIQKAIQENDLLPQPIVIINVPGAGGTIGSRQAMEAKPDGYTFLCLHEGIMSAKYAGNTEYGPEAFAPVAGTGEVGNVIAVAEDSKYQNLEQLLSDAAERPEKVIFSANIGAPSHFIGLMLENTKMGAKFRYTQTGGGAKRFAALIGGHIDVSAFSMAEYKQFQSAGLRALAYCGESRHPQALEIPTATEQGFDVVTSIMQFWWAPKKTPSEKIKVVAEALRKAMKTPQVQESLKAIHTDAIFLAGQELKNSLQEREQRFANVVQRDLTQLPNFPIIVLGGVLVLALLAGFQAVQNSDGSNQETQPDKHDLSYVPRRLTAVLAILLTAGYVLSMEMGWSGFRVATFVYVMFLGLILIRLNPKQIPVLLGIAVLMSLGMHFVFTNVFAIVLP